MQVQNEQLPHALLLVGGLHAGLPELALALTRLLLCSEPEGSHNCGHCHACVLSASGAHGDFRWVEPVEKSRVIKVDQVRDAVQFSNQTAAFGLRKVIVLAPADNMNLDAYNALLKSLEEPAANTFWILVCHGIFGVPATIRSRCQIRRLAIPDEVSALDWLDKKTGDREQSQALLSLSGWQTAAGTANAPGRDLRRICTKTCLPVSADRREYDSAGGSPCLGGCGLGRIPAGTGWRATEMGDSHCPLSA